MKYETLKYINVHIQFSVFFIINVGELKRKYLKQSWNVTLGGYALNAYQKISTHLSR